MKQVADVFLETVDLQILSTDEQKTTNEIDLRNRLAFACVSIHKLVVETAERFYAAYKRHYYLTPSSYMDLMKAYDKMMTQTKQEFLVKKREIVRIGLKIYLCRRITIG